MIIIRSYRNSDAQAVGILIADTYAKFNLSFAPPEERKAFHDAGGHGPEGCPVVCGVAARIAAEVILGIKEG